MTRPRIFRIRGAVRRFAVCLGLALAAARPVPAADPAGVRGADRGTVKGLNGFDAYMEKLVKDWNVPGIGVGIVVKDKLVYAKGYGFRDYGKKIPYTSSTVQPIASNTKLFTAVAIGLLVEEGKLEWDKPVKQFVPSIQFYNDDLNAKITIRDMLSHRSGITRHDSIWYKSDFTRKELFDRLRYLEPTQPLRETFLYNNMMYTGAGYVVELLSGKTWEDFVRGRLFQPLGMTHTVYTIDDLIQQPDHAVPYTERRDSFELYEIPYYREQVAIAPAGAINSNIEDLSKWLIALLNGGRLNGKAVIPEAVVKATLEPSIALPNSGLEAFGYGELLNETYGAGRFTASYRGHLIAFHGGDINGFHSQIGLMPQDGIGVIVLVVGDHAAPLYNVVMYNVFERLTGMSETPWSDRRLAMRLKNKKAGQEARAKAGAEQVKGTKASHSIDDYVGEFAHPAYGVVQISRKGDDLFFQFHRIGLPLSHFHYDRFDTPDDEEDGKWSINFGTSPQGEIDKALISLDEAEVTFTRRPPAELSAIETLRPYAGNYQTPTGAKFEVVLKEDGTLGIAFPGQPLQILIPWKPRKFRVKEFSDVVFEFVVVDGKVTELKQIDPSGEYRNPRK
jgi:CubicO group peptidase (beta-lactamase class C family)